MSHHDETDTTTERVEPMISEADERQEGFTEQENEVQQEMEEKVEVASELETETANEVTEDSESMKNRKSTVDENQLYLDSKEKDHLDIVSMIETAEAELADLRLRKYLIETDFSGLLDSFDRYLLKGEPISPIGKTSLVEYFTYELLKPLNDIGLELSTTTYDRWETRHFSINYSLDEQNHLIFSFVLPTIDQRYQVESINLFEVIPETMEVNVQDDRVLSLIRYWSVERVFSAGQITIFNHKLNQLLAHARKLGFVVNQTLLDNTEPLRLNLQSEFEFSEQVLDDIFIVTMKNPTYDFEKLTEDQFKVLLDKGQSLTITRNEQNQTGLMVSSGEYHRSVIDFFINYEFLVPLMVRKN